MDGVESLSAKCGRGIEYWVDRSIEPWMGWRY